MELSTTRPPRPDFQKVTVDGITWEIISRDERQTTHAGRHFFACRCYNQPLWHIDEMTANENGGRVIRTIASCITKDLSAMVIAVTTPAEAI